MVVDGCNCWYNKRWLCGCEGCCLRSRLMLVATVTDVRQGLGQFVVVLGIVGIVGIVGTSGPGRTFLNARMGTGTGLRTGSGSGVAPHRTFRTTILVQRVSFVLQHAQYADGGSRRGSFHTSSSSTGGTCLHKTLSTASSFEAGTAFPVVDRQTTSPGRHSLLLWVGLLPLLPLLPLRLL